MARRISRTTNVSGGPAAPRPARPPMTSAEIRAKYPRVVAVPKPPATAYDPDRPISGLVANQVRLLQAAEWSLPAEHRSRVAAQAITTEGEASAYIRHVTSRLHPQGAPIVTPAPTGAKRPKAAVAAPPKAAGRRTVRRAPRAVTPHARRTRRAASRRRK